MSQAVSAPITGDGIIEGGKFAQSAAVSTGMSARQSPTRRAVLAGAMMLPVIAIPASAAVSAPMREDSVARSHRIDAKFWAAERRWKAIDAEWSQALSADEDMEDAEFSRWGAMEGDAHRSMMGIGITTLPALLAKVASIKDAPTRDWSQSGSVSMFEVMMWDVERMVSREAFA